MIDKLVQLLNLSNVKKIIYVDDIFCVEREFNKQVQNYEMFL